MLLGGARIEGAGGCGRSEPRPLATGPLAGCSAFTGSLPSTQRLYAPALEGLHPQRAYLAQIDGRLRHLRHAFIFTEGNGGKGMGAEPAGSFRRTPAASPAR